MRKCIHSFDIVSIAGSRTGERTSSQLELDSPGVHSTVHSWDSHANYHSRYDNSEKQISGSHVLPWSRASHIVIYCDIHGHLKTATGVVRLLLLVSSHSCLRVKLKMFISRVIKSFENKLWNIVTLTNAFGRYPPQLVWQLYAVLALPRSAFLCCLL